MDGTIFYGMNIYKKWTFLDHLPNSSCKRLWTTPNLDGIAIFLVNSEDLLYFTKEKSNKKSKLKKLTKALSKALYLWKKKYSWIDWSRLLLGILIGFLVETPTEKAILGLN